MVSISVTIFGHKMNNNTLKSFLSNVSQLTNQYEQLKQQMNKITEENRELKQDNYELLTQNSDAKIALHQIIDQLKEMQA